MVQRTSSQYENHAFFLQYFVRIELFARSFFGLHGLPKDGFNTFSHWNKVTWKIRDRVNTRTCYLEEKHQIEAMFFSRF